MFLLFNLFFFPRQKENIWQFHTCLVLWFDLVPHKSGGCTLDSAKPPGVRGNWWLFGSFLECQMPFNTGFMSSDAWDLWSLKGRDNARIDGQLDGLKRGTH